MDVVTGLESAYPPARGQRVVALARASGSRGPVDQHLSVTFLNLSSFSAVPLLQVRQSLGNTDSYSGRIGAIGKKLAAHQVWQ